MKRNRKLLSKVACSTMLLSSMLGTSYVGLYQMATPVMAVSGPVEISTPGGVANMGSGDASITIKPYNSEPLVGKTFEVHKLFNAENAVGMESINYTFNEKYATALKTVVGNRLGLDSSTVTEYQVVDYMQSLNTHEIEGADADQTLEGSYSEYRYFIEDLRDEIKKEGIVGDKVNVTEVNNEKEGSVTLDGLDYGYYVIDEMSVAGEHAAASLCIVNTANPDAEVQVKSDYPTMTKKISEDDLNFGWNDIGDYEIGQTVPYKYETFAPNMNGYRDYYFAFHDVMDEELTFNKDSVVITVKGEGKDYTLKAGEFSVLEGDALAPKSSVKRDIETPQDTFRIEIPDLKGIIDREFNKKGTVGDTEGAENVYGQQIVLTYNATLNDLAAKDTGRPGFENTARLEFSNNPDSDGEGETGFTPWDTVVCFTYRIDGTKVNNHNKQLKDAKFRLYSDEDCNNEVYVKWSEENNGYIVINRDIVGGTDHSGGEAPEDAVEMSSAEDGVFNIIGLDQGTYWLKETDSPAGYRELLDPIRITIQPTYTDNRQNYAPGDGATENVLKSLESIAYVKDFYDLQYHETTTELETDVETGTANITVVNQVGNKLPITGSSMTVLCVTLGLGVITMVLTKKKLSQR